jgi:hypothetical protein
VPDGYGAERVNVSDQKRDPDSLWSFVRALIQTDHRGTVQLTLEGYGQRWLRVRREDRREL